MTLHYFGTDGVRGKAGAVLTAQMAYRIGRYIGQYPDGKPNRILISRDTRESGSMLLEALAKGMVASGANVYDEGVSTTPSISYLVEKDGFDYGVMISASHNPYSDNGIKIFNSLGEKLQDEIEEKIEAYMDRPEDDLPILKGQFITDPSLKEAYISWLVSKASPKMRGLKVIVDCANGSASALAPELLKRLGVEATVINAAPNGANINAGCGSTHLQSLTDAFHNGKYQFGFAFDGDADRFVALGSDGRLLDGDALIFLNALSLDSQGLLHDHKVVITVMSNFGLRKALDEAKIDYEIVSVGDKYVQARLKEKDLSLGGEQSGHVIFLQDLNTGDGLLSCIKLMNLYVLDRPAYARLSSLKVYPQLLKNVPVPSQDAVDRIMRSEKLAHLQEAEAKRLGDFGRILVRPSGTEPVIRVMVEALDPVLCQQVVDDLVNFIQGGR